MPYFDKEGPENTGKVVEIALATAKERNISHIVVATTTGATASLFKNRPDVEVVAVTHAFGFKEKGKNPLSQEKRKELTDAGISVFTGTHTLSGAERGITTKAGINPVELIAHVLRFFGAGTKVAVEIATAALDAGLIPGRGSGYRHRRHAQGRGHRGYPRARQLEPHPRDAHPGNSRQATVT
jgi:uncharacterized protein